MIFTISIKPMVNHQWQVNLTCFMEQNEKLLKKCMPSLFYSYRITKRNEIILKQLGLLCCKTFG